MRDLHIILERTLRFDGPAIESTDGEPQGRSELLAVAERVAGALETHRIPPGEPILVRIGNRPRDLGALLGIWRLDAVAVPIHVSAAATTVERLRRRTQARLSVDGDRVEVLGLRAPRSVTPDAALVIFTSGSTGDPKGVVIGHSQLRCKLDALERLLGLRADDVVLVPLQLTFIFGLWVTLLTLMTNALLRLAPKFARDAIERGLADATVVAGVPSMFRTLLQDQAPAAPRLRLILTGGEVLTPKLSQAMRRFTHGAIYDLYGLTETGSCDFCLAPADQPAGFGTIGRPTERVSFRIARNGAEVPTGAIGELQLNNAGLFNMHGYFGDLALTQASYEDGYFRTGDLARLRPDGLVELVGRAKDIVSRGGLKIAPLEIDNLLTEHPDIAAALCAGVPDERLGEVLHAVVVPRAGARLDVRALRDWLLVRTERYKVPDVFHIRDALPAGATGKADRRAVAGLALPTRGDPTS